MSLRKKGYTLVEILIAFAIVGIIAAITIPFLVKNVEKLQAGARLGKAVRQIELGARNIIEEANANISSSGSSVTVLNTITIDDLLGNDNDTIITQYSAWDILTPYYNFEPVNIDDMDLNIDYYNGENYYNNEEIRWYCRIYSIKGMPDLVIYVKIYFVEQNGDEEVVYADFYIDTNGFKPPNRVGRDIFFFFMSNKGKLYPYGLQSPLLQNFDTDHYTVACTDNNITDGKACAARVVKDGFKINYY